MLHFDLKINNTIIGRCEIVRRTNLDSPTLEPGDVSLYSVRYQNYPGLVKEFNLEHTYGDGAEELARKALAKL